MANVTVTEPFPIFAVAGRYLLYDVDTVMYARRAHHICGVLIGNIPSANQQNIFSGVPLELIPEEVRLLTEEGHAYIIDDVNAHRKQLQDLSQQERQRFRKHLDKQGLEAAAEIRQSVATKKAKALSKVGQKRTQSEHQVAVGKYGAVEEEEALFNNTRRSSVSPVPSLYLETPLQPQLVSPSTSYPPLPAIPSDPPFPLPPAPTSYALFKHLHERGYWMTPGLRFGCEYSVYPGDPLRFHSHFLGVSLEWEEEFDLLEIVGGGRLGTGVKKGYLIGGTNTDPEDFLEKNSSGDDVRVFCLEWAAL